MKEPDITIIKTGKSPTLSGKPTLTYNLGKSPDDQLQLRIKTNSGAGHWNVAWVPLDRIREALEN